MREKKTAAVCVVALVIASSFAESLPEDCYSDDILRMTQTSSEVDAVLTQN
ncbi:MAG: hypothetical protein HXS54_16230 [Theionarchaea archaeon]|nr:hypothetical protein [Theionarchaea archaeon]